MSTRISQIPQTDENVVKSHNVYPGDDQCRGHSPHALWHEESANGLLEIVFLGDFMHKILSKTKTVDSKAHAKIVVTLVKHTTKKLVAENDNYALAA